MVRKETKKYENIKAYLNILVNTNMKKVLILQHIDIETPGIITEILKNKNIETDCQKLSNMEYRDISDIESKYDGLILMGGPMSVNDKKEYNFIEKEIQLIKKYLDSDKAILGICLGSQLIASALGSKISKNSKKELGFQTVKKTSNGSEDSLFKNINDKFLAFHWHQDIFSLPPNAKLLAHNRTTEFQAFKYGNKCYALLFHIEVTSEIITNIVTEFESDLISESIEKDFILNNLEKNLSEIHNTGIIILNEWASIV